MTEQLFISYKSEKEFLAEEYLNNLKNICENMDQIIEADSEEQFCAHKWIEKSPGNSDLWLSLAGVTYWLDNKEHSLSCVMPHIDKYFAYIVDCMQNALENEEQFVQTQKDILEQWFTVKSCRISNTNTYLMAPCHPVVQLIDYSSQKLVERFNRKYEENKGNSSAIEWEIGKAILQDYLDKNEEFFVYRTGQVYLSKREESCRKAIPWQDVGTLTPIDGVRLIKKIESWIHRNKEKIISDNLKEVKIAYIGTINYQDQVYKYFENRSICLNEKKFTFRLVFVQLKRKTEYGYYAFERQDNPENGKRIFNLSLLMDMKELFSLFNIVLFLDESYFYKQRQNPKGLMEKGAAEYVKWCQTEMTRRMQLTDDEEKETETEEKIYFYKEIYNKAGLWVNGYGEDLTSKLSFDQELFGIINQAWNPSCDVYLYISKGKRIGNINLLEQSICNDERYNGKKILVYKVSGKETDTEEIQKAVEVLIQNFNEEVCIDLWKLVKSIGSTFAYPFFSHCDVKDNETIDQLKQTYLIVGCKENEQASMNLVFSLYCSNPEQCFVDDFVWAFLDNCGRSEFGFVKNYLFDLLISAMVSRASSVEGLMLAYLMQKRVITMENFEYLGITGQHKPEESENLLFRARRSIYSAIKGLDQILVRDMDSRMDILIYEFRHMYCADIDEENFIKLLVRIHKCCDKMSYKDSRIYLLTQLENERGL